MNAAEIVREQLSAVNTDATQVREIALWSWNHANRQLRNPVCDDKDSIEWGYSSALGITDRAIDRFRREASGRVWTTVRNLLLNSHARYLEPALERRAYVVMVARAKSSLIDDLWLCRTNRELT